MKVARSTLMFIFLCCPSLSGVFAQVLPNQPDPGFANRWNIGINVGPDFYYGDLTYGNSGPKRNLSMGGSLVIGYQITNVFGTRLQLLGAWLNGSTDSLINGELVSNPLTGILVEGNLQAIINFTNIFSPYRSSRWFLVYGTAGLGYAGWYTEFSNEVYDAGTINTKNPLNNFHAALVFPVGLGIQLRLGDRVNASMEYTFHLVGSDLLDQTLARSNNDRFDYLAFGISLNLGKGPKKMPPVYYEPPPVRPTPRILDPTPPAPREPNVETPRVSIPVQPPKATAGPYTYSVQICAFARYTHSADWIRQHYRVPMSVRVEKDGHVDRFMVGEYPDAESARQLRNRMVKLGIRDAFIVVYQDGVRHHVVKNP